MVEIQVMTIRDYEETYALWLASEGVGLSQADSRDEITAYLARNPGLSFVARDGARLVGAVLCGHDGRRGYLHHLAVARDFRKQGVARLLLQAVMKGLLKLKIEKCNIFLFANNHDGRAFWLHNGWKDRQDLDVLQFLLIH